MLLLLLLIQRSLSSGVTDGIEEQALGLGLLARGCPQLGYEHEGSNPGLSAGCHSAEPLQHPT